MRKLRVPVPPVVPDFDAIAKSELDDYIALVLPKEPPLTVWCAPKWWREKKVQFHLLGKVVRSELSTSASSGRMEADFCQGKRLITPLRVSMDPVMASMCMLLNINQDCLPPMRKIPTMSRAEATEASKDTIFERAFMLQMIVGEVGEDDDVAMDGDV
jgi:hypothetical protein